MVNRIGSTDLILNGSKTVFMFVPDLIEVDINALEIHFTDVSAETWSDFIGKEAGSSCPISTTIFSCSAARKC